MPETIKQGLIKKSTLTEAEIAEIIELSTLCNQQDNLHMRISVKELRERPGTQIDDFFYYEQNALVGYLYIDTWGKEEKEITGMVAPEFRRRGIARRLFEEAREECKARKVEDLIIVCEQNAHAGHAFAKAVKTHHDFSEHKMVLGNFVERGQTDPQFEMHHATLADKEAIISVLASDVGDQDDARQLVEELYAAPDQQLYLSTLAGKPLGTLRLTYEDEVVGIYGFVIRPEFRGRGYGRQMLEYSIHAVYDQKPGYTIMLEVDTSNHTAIGLYGSCGFSVQTTYDYLNHTI